MAEIFTNKGKKNKIYKITLVILAIVLLCVIVTLRYCKNNTSSNIDMSNKDNITHNGNIDTDSDLDGDSKKDNKIENTDNQTLDNLLNQLQDLDGILSGK